MKCGCHVPAFSGTVIFCAMHEAASDLLDAMRLYVEWHGPTCEHATRDDCLNGGGCPGRPVDDAVNAAIAKAEGRFKEIRVTNFRLVDV